MDVHVSRAAEQVERVLAASERAPTVASFFDEKTFTASYVVHDPVTRRAAIVDSVMDFDHAAGRIVFHSSECIAGHVVAEGL